MPSASTPVLGVVAPTAAPAAMTAPDPTAMAPLPIESPHPVAAPTAAPAPPLEPPSPQPLVEALAATLTPVPPPATPAPTAPPTPEPTLALVMETAYDEFGFRLRLERGADVRPAGTPSVEQGIVSFAYGNVNTILTWTPQADGNLLALVSGTYDLLRDNQPGWTFETLKDSGLTVDGEAGLFLGFKAVDGSNTASGGLIGAWTCRASQRSFTLMLTGADAAVVQVRFDGLLDNFKCSI